MVSKDVRIQFLCNNTKVKGLKHAFEADISTKKFIVKILTNSIQLFFSPLQYLFIYFI